MKYRRKVRRYQITIVTTYKVDIPELDDDTREYITENFEHAMLPEPYDNADDLEFVDGSITYEEEN